MKAVSCRDVAMTLNPAVLGTPRFLLLHILAHILIRQIESEAGSPPPPSRNVFIARKGKTYVRHPDLRGRTGCGGSAGGIGGDRGT